MGREWIRSRERDERAWNREPRYRHTEPEDAASVLAPGALRPGHDVQIPEIVAPEADARHHGQRAPDALTLATVWFEHGDGAAPRQRDPDRAVLRDGESVRNALVHGRERSSRADAAVRAHVVHSDDARATVGVIEAR